MNADFLADTSELSAAEVGAYSLLIVHYWRNGSLPNDDRELMRISRLLPRQWSKSRKLLAALFDGGWKSAKIDSAPWLRLYCPAIGKT